MEFYIERTSDWFHKKPPVKNRQLRLVPKNKKDAYSKNEWYIEINSLEDLVKLSEEEGSLIFNPGHIEIYDDYRE